MKLSVLGEKEIISRLGSFLNVSDDAACVRHGGEYLVLSTDMMHQKTHVLPGMSWEQIGAFIVSVNVSDIAAMGARPVAFLMACGLPRSMEYADLDRMLRAAEAQCERYGAKYVGGDTKEARDMTLSGFCMGRTKRPVHRSGARKGDIVAVTGDFGAASLGVTLLLSGIREKGDRAALQKAVAPCARVGEGLLIGRYANSLTDTSDSLATCLHDIASASGVGMTIDEDMIPIAPATRRLAEKLGLSAVDCALGGGGDYELVYTVPKGAFFRIRKKIETTQIGRVGGEGIFLESSDGSRKRLEKTGYEHFK